MTDKHTTKPTIVRRKLPKRPHRVTPKQTASELRIQLQALARVLGGPTKAEGAAAILLTIDQLKEILQHLEKGDSTCQT